MNTENIGTLYDLVDKNPDLNWVWEELGANPNFQIEQICYLREKYNKPKNLCLCKNLNFQIEHVFKYKNENLSWADLSKNPNITMDIIQEYNYMRWEQSELVRNPNLTWEFISNKADNGLVNIYTYDICYFDPRSGDYDHDRSHLKEISANPNISISTIINKIIFNDNESEYENYDYAFEELFSMEYFLKNPNLIITDITDEDLLEIIEKNIKYLHYNPNIDIKCINRYKHLRLDWSELVVSSKITVEDIFNNSDLPWIKYWWFNPNVRPHHLIKHNIRNPAQWISASKYSPLDCIKDHLNYLWNWCELSSNINLTLDFIETNLNYNWDWTILSGNPILTIDFIRRHPEIKWSAYYLSNNEMTFNKTIYSNNLNKYLNKTHLIIQIFKQIIKKYI